MNWREWARDVVLTDPMVVNTAGSRVFQRNTMTTVPDEEPFVVVGFRPSERGPFPGSKNLRMGIWVHDRGGSYTRIDDILQSIRKTIEAASSSQDFIAATWEGDGDDQEDDALSTLVRVASFRLAGKETE